MGTPGHHATLTASLELSIDGLPRESIEVLNTLACLAAFPYSWPEPKENLPAPFDNALSVYDALGHLRARSLVQHAGEKVLIHDLVREFTVHRLDPLSHAEYTFTAALLVAAQLPEWTNEADSWLAMEQLLPHALHLTETLLLPPNISEQKKLAAYIATKTAPYLRSQGQQAQAEALLQRAISSLEVGDSDDEYALHLGSLLTNLGVIQTLRGHLTLAISTLERALAYKESHPRASPLLIGVTYGALAQCHYGLGEHDRAEELNLRALQLYRDSGSGRMIADALMDLAQIDLVRGNGTLAIERLREAVDVADNSTDAWSMLSRALTQLARLTAGHGNLVLAMHFASDAVRVAGTQTRVSQELAYALSVKGAFLLDMALYERAEGVLRASFEIYDRLPERNIHEQERVRGNLGSAMLQTPAANYSRDLVEQALCLLNESAQNIWNADNGAPCAVSEFASWMYLQALMNTQRLMEFQDVLARHQERYGTFTAERLAISPAAPRHSTSGTYHEASDAHG